MFLNSSNLRGVRLAFPSLLLSAVLSFGGTVYIGDIPSQGKDLEAGTIGPDGSNGGDITYAFFEDGFLNDTGAPLNIVVSEVNFWAANTGTLIPYVATYNGEGGVPGSNYDVLLVGDSIQAEFDLNQTTFDVTDGSNSFSLENGDTLIAGFWQDGGIVTWESPEDSDGDYIQTNNQIPEDGGALNGDANWSDLGREYRFTIRLETGEITDDDNDGLPDSWETENGLSPEDDGSIDPENGPDGDPDADNLTNLVEFEKHTHPVMADTDSDGLNDDEELAGAGNRPPTKPTNADTDGDGLNDNQESNTMTYVDENDVGSSPTSADSDGDTLSDGDEVFANNAHSFFSSPNLRDTDGDTYEDPLEIRRGSDPNDADDTPPILAGPDAIFLGDVPDQEFDVETGTIGPDTAGDPPGNITYAFFEDAYTNETGTSLRLEVSNVNFWAAVEGEVTPYVARVSGADPTDGGSYEVLAVGDPITAALDLNNADFLVNGENPIVTVEDGESIIAGFHQDVGLVPWESPPDSDGDYIAANNLIPETLGDPLGGNAGWSDLGREYRFNVVLKQDNPQEILLSFDQILTSAQTGDIIGSFVTVDSKPDATHIYSLVEGEGSTDNSRFSVADGQLGPADGADFSGESNDASLSIRVRAEDSADTSRFVEKMLPLTVKIDSDEDELPDDWEALWAANGDLDILSGLADADADADNLSDIREYLISVGQDGDTPSYPDIDPTNADGDGDTLNDDVEVTGAGDRPSTNPAVADTDGDGLDDNIETNTKTFVDPSDSGTDPTVADTDGDSLSDGDEVNGSGPSQFTSNPHLVDTDGDGFNDNIEIDNDSDPNDPDNVPDVVSVELVNSNLGDESWETGSDWSDGNPANSSGAYTVPSGFTLQTPARSNPGFPGVSLTISGGSSLTLLGEGATTINDLQLTGGFLSHQVVGKVMLDGNLKVLSQSGIQLINNNSSLQISSAITGRGELIVAGEKSTTIELTGNNAGYLGGWDINNATLRGLNANSLGKGSIKVRDGRLDVDYDMAIDGSLELEGEGVKLVLDQDIRVGAFLIAGVPANDLPGAPDPDQTVFDLAWFEAVKADFILEGDSTGSITVVGIEPPTPQDLQITQVSIVDGNIQLRWASVPGIAYEILFSQDLLSGNFTVIGTMDGAAEPNMETSFSAPDPVTTQTEGYYVVREKE